MNWYFEVWRKYAVFSGRARRKELWLFVLFNGLVFYALLFIDVFGGFAIHADDTFFIGVFGTSYQLAVIIPALAVAVRRLHDTGRSGWWLLLGLIPIIGAIALLVIYMLDSQEGENKYGPNPKEE